MVQLKFKGPQIGSDLGTVAATVAGNTKAITIPSFVKPAVAANVPTINDGFDTDTLDANDAGITPTTRIWRVVGGAVQGNDATLSGSGLGGEWIEYSPDNGMTWSPPIMVHAGGMMAAHAADDAAVLTIVPHADMTHIAVQDGDWSDPATWSTGRAPAYGAVVLIPHGFAVKYDETRDNVRLDRIRVDGRLWVDTVNATTEQFKLLVETIVVTRGGDFEIGTAANRMPATASFTVTISGKDYSTASYLPTDMNGSRFADARGWERGVIFMGRGSLWGAEKLTWAKADPVDAGATSLTLHASPAGLSVGDTIVIGGTDCNFLSPNPVWEDEERVVTGISGTVISWADPLQRAHKNQLANSSRTDLYPAVIIKGNKNITFRSEVVEDNARRGHAAWMHHHCTVDVWDAQFIDLGRTDKSTRAGVINGSGDFVRAGGVGNAPVTSPLAVRDNLQARYAVHLHHVGFDHAENARPMVNNCYVEDTPGWAMVHHACDADFQDCAMYKFVGAGLVSESSNEVGAWIDCVAMHSTASSDRLNLAMKTAERFQTQGDTFWLGYAFAYRGRALRVARCVGVSSYLGHGFFPRQEGDLSSVIARTVNVKRANVDVKEAGALPLYEDYKNGDWDKSDYPIIHFEDCESIGCLWGFAVTKNSPRQFHDINIKLKRFKAWGFFYHGGDIEYVGGYLFDHWDLVSGQKGAFASTAMAFGQNAHQQLMRGIRIEGSHKAVTALMFSNVLRFFDHDADDPRWGYVGADFVDVDITQDFSIGVSANDSHTDVYHKDQDWDDTAIDYDADPTESYPLVIGTIDGSDILTTVGNGAGQKSDNLSANAPILQKVWDAPFRNNEYFLRRSARYVGYWQYGGKDVYVVKDIISDRVTARPFKMTKIYETPLDTFFDDDFLTIDNGAWTYGANPTTANDLTAVVAKNGSVTINVPIASGAAGGDGSAYSLDTDDNIAPNNGRAVLDAGTGEVTFSPDRNFTGADEMYVFVESGHRFATVRIAFLVTEDGTDAGITTPVVDTHVAAVDGGSQTIDVTLSDRPDTSGRNILLVQYSTDGGATWRRLCFGWIKATHQIKHPSASSADQSDAATLSTGAQNVRIRYKTDYDFVTSAESGDDVVTVT